MSGVGRSDETAPSKRGTAKALPQAVHSYATTRPNNSVRGTNLAFPSLSSNESHPRLLFQLRCGMAGKVNPDYKVLIC